MLTNVIVNYPNVQIHLQIMIPAFSFFLSFSVTVFLYNQSSWNIFSCYTRFWSCMLCANRSAYTWNIDWSTRSITITLCIAIRLNWYVLIQSAKLALLTAVTSIMSYLIQRSSQEGIYFPTTIPRIQWLGYKDQKTLLITSSTNLLIFPTWHRIV